MRNKDEVNVKPITQTRIPNDYYNPSAYLTPFAEANRARSLSTARSGMLNGPNINSIQAAKLLI